MFTVETKAHGETLWFVVGTATNREDAMQLASELQDGFAGQVGVFPDEDEDEDEGGEFEDDGQPTEYEEWQDLYGGDDWDHGQYDDGGGDW